MNLSRWQEVTPSEFAWELEALNYLKARLPDGEPFRAWSNFEFIGDDGSINEIDLLVVSLYKVYLVEIKSWAGVISGDQGTWRRDVSGRQILVDNPLLLANRKAKKLRSLLHSQKAFAKERMPFIEAAVFLSHTGVQCRLSGHARTGVYLSGTTERDKSNSTILQVLTGETGFDRRRPPQRIDRSLSGAFSRAMGQAGIRPSQRQRRVADYVLQELLLETDAWQDWEAKHVTIDTRRRVRIYPLSRTSSETTRTELQRAAEREYRLLDGVAHDGVLRVELFTNADQGPALVFEHDPTAERLDHFLRRKQDALKLGTRLVMLRQLGETLKYTHERRLYHRALCPARILVVNPEATCPTLKIFDWQAGKYEFTQSSQTRGTASQTMLGLSGDEQNDVYLAPETGLGGYAPEKLDVFSLGAVGYHLLSSQPPAATIGELQQRLSADRGLQLSDALDGAPEELQLAIACATDPEVSERLDSARAFLEQLDAAERELIGSPEPESGTVHPLDARSDDMLEQGFLVEQRLGKGSTAIALEVAHDTGNGVLKVALEPTLNDRILREGELLQTLRHQNIVEVYGDYELSGHAALFMAKAGTENKTGTYTLADRIREEGRLSLDLLQRFGDQLIGVAEFLEENGVSHRDIKPDNVGVSESRTDKSLTLVVFDFSLVDTPAENIRAGTPQYLDPFLKLRQPPRWDSSCERFAVAMTLHEMATGQLPSWGDGLTDPALIDDEVSLDAELFDPSVRDALSQFFRTALARDYDKRFHNAEEMRRDWFRCFESIDVSAGGDDEIDDLPKDFAGITEATRLADFGLSARMLNALERIGAHTVGELLALPRIRLYRNKGIGQRIVRRIRELSEHLAEHFADRTDTLEPLDEELVSSVDPTLWSIDMLAAQLVPRRIDPETARLQRWTTGLEGDLGLVPGHRSVATALSVSPTAVADAVRNARERWQRQPWMTPLRSTVAAQLQGHGGIMSARELAEALVGARGSTATGSTRLRLAGAVAVAALEVESGRSGCRFALHREGDKAMILATPALEAACTAQPQAVGQWIRKLAQRVDMLAALDPLAAPGRVLTELSDVTPPADVLLSPERILRLAVEAASSAALSSRGELYPRGMAGERAIKLGASSLLGPKSLTVKQVWERIASRYPEAQSLPERPALDALLEQAELALVWHRDAGRYDTPSLRPTYLTSTSTLHATQDDGALALDKRLRRLLEKKGFLALSVPPQYMLQAEQHVADSFGMRLYSLEGALLEHMREVAEELGASWQVVIDADAAQPGSQNRRRLDQLVRRSIDRLIGEVEDTPEPLLLTRPGLLARYQKLEKLMDIQDACQRGTAPAARVLIVVADASSAMPEVDGQALPVVLNAAWTRPGRGWLAHVVSREKAEKEDLGT